MTYSPIEPHLVAAEDHAHFYLFPERTPVDGVHIRLDHTLQMLCEEANEVSPPSHTRLPPVQLEEDVCPECAEMGLQLQVVNTVKLRIKPERKRKRQEEDEA